MSLGYSPLETSDYSLLDQQQLNSQKSMLTEPQYQQTLQLPPEKLPTYNFCPNAKNPYHWCTDYCYHHYGPRAQSQQPQYRQIKGVWYQVVTQLRCSYPKAHNCSRNCSGVKPTNMLYPVQGNNR